MRAIVNGKLYDTEKATRIGSEAFYLPQIGKQNKYISVYKTTGGNIFAESLEEGILLDGDEIKRICSGNPKAVDVYIQIFGTLEEAYRFQKFFKEEKGAIVKERQVPEITSDLKLEFMDEKDQIECISAYQQFVERINPLIAKYADKLPEKTTFLFKM